MYVLFVISFIHTIIIQLLLHIKKQSSFSLSTTLWMIQSFTLEKRYVVFHEDELEKNRCSCGCHLNTCTVYEVMIIFEYIRQKTPSCVWSCAVNLHVYLSWDRVTPKNNYHYHIIWSSLFKWHFFKRMIHIEGVVLCMYQRIDTIILQVNLLNSIHDNFEQ